MLTSAEKWGEFLAILQRSFNRARPSLQRTKDCYQNDFERRFSKGHELTEAGDYVFIDVSNSVTKIQKLGRGFGALYAALKQDQDKVVFQRMNLVRSTADRVARALRAACVPPILQESASATDNENRDLEGGTSLFPELLEHCILYDLQLGFLSNGGHNFEAT